MRSHKKASIASMIVKRLKDRNDSEHVQAIIRVVMTAVVAVYLNSDLGARINLAPWGDALSIVYFVISLVLLSWIVIDPEISYLRRYSAMVGEHMFVSLGLLLEGERAAPLFLIYIWVSLGNGFRYGIRPLLVSTTISTLGFVTVILISPFWQSVLPLSIGIVLAMIAIPLYASSLIRQLRAAKAAAEQASHTKSRFLATASHELRTPLHAIIGLSELLQQTPLSSEQLEMVQTVRGSGRALLSLVEDVLDLSSIQAGRAVSNLQAFNLHDAIAEATAIARPQAARKDLSLAVRIAPDIPASLRGDWPHLRQILLNLITNAIKFTDSGQVTLTVEALEILHDEVQLALTVSDTGIGIAQKDLNVIFETFGQANTSSTRKYGGVGLGLAIVRQLADMMHGTVSVNSVIGQGSAFTVELPMAREPNMTVLEKSLVVLLHSKDASLLPLVQVSVPEFMVTTQAADIPEDTDAVIELIDVRHSPASIDAASREIAPLKFPCALIALGTTISAIERVAPDVVCCVEDIDSATLRAAMLVGGALASHGELTAALPAEKNLADIPAFKIDSTIVSNGARVLVVEDSPVNRMVTQKILASASYNVFLADGADQGLELLADKEFDIILLDLNMPGMNGLDMIKLYQMMRLGQSMPPIVIFSADVTAEARAECEELGVSLFLPKPSEPAFMLQQLAALAPVRPIIETVIPDAAPPVVEISSHPRYRATPEFGIVDRHALQSLASLDTDLSFLGDLIAEFEKDTVDVLAMIDRSVSENDMPLFWDQLHAMRSSGANVGAKQIMIACNEISQAGKLSFRTRGFEYAARLRYEFNRFSRTMDRFLLRQAKAAR